MAHKGVQPSGQSDSSYAKCYDYSFINPPPDRLICKICHFPCYEAQLTECCGHVYCQSCGDKVKIVADREYSCPMCREANFKTIAHHEANRAIKELLIYCPNNKEERGKCSWTGPLGGLNRHLKDCKVECRRCGLSLGYHAMRRHLATLSCKCKHCHSKKQCCCLVVCPNKCGQDILRDKVDEHRKVCPSKVVECKYKCGVKLPQCDIEKHYKTCKCQVENFQSMYNENLKNIYKEIKTNAGKISEAKDTLKDEMDMLKQSVENIEQITGDYEKYQGILGCNSLLLLIILVLLISLTVTLTKMQANLEMFSNDHENNKALKEINHKDAVAELRSNNQHKTNKNPQTDNLKNLWLSN